MRNLFYRAADQESHRFQIPFKLFERLIQDCFHTWSNPFLGASPRRFPAGRREFSFAALIFLRRGALHIRKKGFQLNTGFRSSAFYLGSSISYTDYTDTSPAEAYHS